MATQSVIASSALKAPAIAAPLQQETKPVCLLGRDRLNAARIVVRQTPYEIKVS